MTSKRFQRRIEDFICFQCGKSVEGNGYTNHCPYCLWSKHVDNFPGDRGNSCKGEMMPIGTDRKNGENVLVHQCLNCGEERRVKFSPDDNLDVLTESQ